MIKYLYLCSVGQFKSNFFFKLLQITKKKKKEREPNSYSFTQNLLYKNR